MTEGWIFHLEMQALGSPAPVPKSGHMCFNQLNGWMPDMELHNLVFDLLGFSLDLNLSFLPGPSSSLSKWDCLLCDVCWNYVTILFCFNWSSGL